MNSYLTPAQFREHAKGIPLGDDALGRILDDIAEEVDDRFGDIGSATETIRPGEDRGPLILRRAAASISTVTEYLGPFEMEPETRILAADDYVLETSTRLVRLRTGTTPAFGWSRYGVTVAYVPRDDTVRRTMAIVDVAKLELAHSGYTSIRIGDYAATKAVGTDDLSTERTRILRSRLAPRRGFVMR